MGHSSVSVKSELVIVGGGIVGAACACALARDGRQVLVIERGPIGGGATAAGMGHIVTMDDSPAQLALTSYSRRLWHQLLPSLPGSAEYDMCGTLWVAADGEEMEAVEQKQLTLARCDIASQVLSTRELAEAEPQLREGLTGGLRVPHDLVVYPPSVARHLLEQASGLGATIRTDCRVERITDDGTIMLAGAGNVEAGLVIVATGCWASSLVPGLPLRPRKGHLVITDRYPGFVRHQLIELGYLKSARAAQRESVAFNIQPRKTGQMLIGSSRQFDAEGTDVELDIVRKMLRRAAHYLPAIARLSAIRSWAGHRAATDDKLPLIGPSVASERIWLATGHEGLGITTSLGTAQLVADLLAGREPQIPAAPYLPGRYGEPSRTNKESAHE